MTVSIPAPVEGRLRAQPAFLRLLVARVLGTGANQMLMVALGWQMYDLTSSAWQLGLVGLVQFVPALLFTLPAGQLADRHDRRRLLVAALLLQAAVATWLGLGSHQGWVTPDGVLAVSALLGVARALQMPAQQALLPSLVPAPMLSRAVAAGGSALQVAVIGGPALGGALYAWASHAPAGVHAGAAAVHGCAAVLLLAAAVAVLSIQAPQRPVPPRGGWDTLLAGLRFVTGRPVLLGAISLDLFAVLLGGATALLPIYARDLLHTGPEGLGLLRAAPAVGALVTGLWLARHPVERHAGRWLLAGVGVYGVATLVFGLSTVFGLSLAALAVSGAADMLSVVIRQSLVQLETPDDMRGRVAAVNSVFIGASNQLGEFESGATAAWLGPVGSVLLGGAGTLLVVALWPRLFPALARRDRLHEA